MMMMMTEGLLWFHSGLIQYVDHNYQADLLVAKMTMPVVVMVMMEKVAIIWEHMNSPRE